MSAIEADQLTWQQLTGANAALCQFMMNLNLRDGDYLVAFDQQQDIVAAGYLHAISADDAIIEVMVSPVLRRCGIGREVVRRLINIANTLRLQRIVSYQEPLFWSKLGFLATVDKASALLLPPAHQALQNTWHSGIPMTAYMGLTIATVSPSSFSTKSELAASINVHQTMFAGSIYSQAVLTGWGLVHLALQRVGMAGSIVLAQGDIRYRRPIAQDPVGLVEQDIELDSLLPLLSGDKVSIELEVKMFGQDQTRAAAIFNGRYVIIPK